MEDGQNAGRHGGHSLFSLSFFIAQVPGIIIRRTVVFFSIFADCGQKHIVNKDKETRR